MVVETRIGTVGRGTVRLEPLYASVAAIAWRQRKAGGCVSAICSNRLGSGHFVTAFGRLRKDGLSSAIVEKLTLPLGTRNLLAS